VWIAIEEPHVDIGGIRSSGILYDKIVINSPIHDEVIAFPEEEWGKVTDLFSLPFVELQPTNLTGIFYYKFEGTEEKPKVDEKSPQVKVESWNGQGMNQFVQLTEKMLLPVIKKDIILSVPHGYNSPLNLNPNEFHIRIWSQIPYDGDLPEFSPTHYWGIPISCQDSFFGSSGTGVDIFDSDGQIAAELIENTLYIHHDLVHYGETDRMRNQLAILTKIYESTINFYKNPGEFERIKRDRELIEFSNMLKNMTTKRINTATKNLDKQTRTVEEYRNYLVGAVREQMHCLQELNFLNDPKFSGISDEVVAKQWKELKSIPGITGVTVSRGKINVTTELIYIVSEESTYELGPFGIIIDTVNNSVKATTYGAKGTRTGCYHPHINSGGSICFGNLSDAITSALIKLDIPVLVNLIFELLNNYTSGDAYEQIIYFKNIKNGTKEEKTG
jgi:hypothetical protein